LLHVSKPRARISRSENRGKPFSALGELLWYLTGSDKLEFIQPYVERYTKEAAEDGAMHGAYGPRLFAMRGSVDQIANVTELFNWLRVSRTGQICPYTFDKLGLFMSFAAV
jgi:thymidylate synthase